MSPILAYPRRFHLVFSIAMLIMKARAQDAYDISVLASEVKEIKVNKSVECLSYCFSERFDKSSCVTGFFGSSCSICQVYRVSDWPYVDSAVLVHTVVCSEAKHEKGITLCDFGKFFGTPNLDRDTLYAKLICYPFSPPDVEVTTEDDSLNENTGYVFVTARYDSGTTDPLLPSPDDVTWPASAESFQTTPTIRASATSRLDPVSELLPIDSVHSCFATVQTTINVNVTVTATITEYATVNATIRFQPSVEINPTSTEAFINSIVEKMTVKKNETASYKRKYISATDERTSAKSMGLVAVVLLAGLFVFIGLIDSRQLLVDLTTLRANIDSRVKNN